MAKSKKAGSSSRQLAGGSKQKVGKKKSAVGSKKKLAVGRKHGSTKLTTGLAGKKKSAVGSGSRQVAVKKVGSKKKLAVSSKHGSTKLTTGLAGKKKSAVGSGSRQVAVKKVGSKKKLAVSSKQRTSKRPRISNLVYQTSFKTHITSLKEGDVAPFFVGHDQHENQVSLNDFTGKTLVLYFYPKDDTSGCTAQSCSLRDEYKYLTLQNYAVVGVSADDIKSHKKFADKFSLPFPLIADVNKDMIKAYDVWGKKMLYGRIYDGIVRTTFIIKDGKIERVISAVDTEGHGKQVMSE